MTPDQVRGSRRWKSLRAVLIREADTCAICFLPLRKEARPRSPLYPSVDHIVPLSENIALAFERSNLRVVHTRCNSSRVLARRADRRIQRHRPAVRASWY
jgi:5-methylcytosine-specific restriction endonuclease McrA